MIVAVDDRNFDEVVLQAEVPVLVLFHTGFDTFDLERLNQMAFDYSRRPPFLLICQCLRNGDSANTLPSQRVTSVPAFLVYSQDRPVARQTRHIIRVSDPTLLREWLNKVLARLARK